MASTLPADVGLITDGADDVDKAVADRWSNGINNLKDAYSKGHVYDVTHEDFDDGGATGNGSTDDTTAITDAITAAGATGHVLFPPGSYKITSDFAFTAGAHVTFMPGASLTASSAKTVTMNSTISAGLYQIIAGSVTMTFTVGACKEVYPQWWGAKGNDSTECTAAFIAALIAANIIGRIYIASGTYKVSTPITGWPGETTSYTGLDSGIVFEGAGPGKTIIKYYGSSGYALEIEPSDVLLGKSCNDHSVKNMQFQCSSIANIEDGGAISSSGNGNVFKGLTFNNCNTATCFNFAGRDVTQEVTAASHDTDNDFTTTDGGTEERYAIKFTTGNSASSRNIPYWVKLTMGRTGSPAGTTRVEIWTDDGGSPGEPNTQIGNNSAEVTSTAFSNAAGGAEYRFWFGKEEGIFELAANTDYWLAIITTGYTYTDGVTEVRLRVEAGAGDVDGFATYSAAGGTWSTSNDYVNFELHIETFVGYHNIITQCRSYGATAKVGRVLRTGQWSVCTIGESFFACKQGLFSEGSTVFVKGVYWFNTGGGPLYELYGGTIKVFATLSENGGDNNIGGNKASIEFAVGRNEAGYWDTTPGVILVCNDGRNELLYGTYDPQNRTTVFANMIITARGGKWESAGQTEDDVVVDADALDGYCLQLDAQTEFAGIHVGLGTDSYYGQLAAGTYKVTAWLKDTNQVASDARIITQFRNAGGGYSTDTTNDLTLTSTYRPYYAFLRVKSSNFTTDRHDHRFYIYKSSASANTISLSHIQIEFIGSENVGGQDVVCYSAEESDADGSRQSRVRFLGHKSGGELSWLGEIVAQHDGTADNDRGELAFSITGTVGSLQGRGVNMLRLSATIPEFTDGDATPSVGGYNTYKTANTGGTTITMLDGNVQGKKVTIIFGDANTTIDFTGTNLKGNSGVDWTPATNDHMECVYDGTNWYCNVSDNTA